MRKKKKKQNLSAEVEFKRKQLRQELAQSMERFDKVVRENINATLTSNPQTTEVLTTTLGKVQYFDNTMDRYTDGLDVLNALGYKRSTPMTMLRRKEIVEKGLTENSKGRKFLSPKALYHVVLLRFLSTKENDETRRWKLAEFYAQLTIGTTTLQSLKRLQGDYEKDKERRKSNKEAVRILKDLCIIKTNLGDVRTTLYNSQGERKYHGKDVLVALGYKNISVLLTKICKETERLQFCDESATFISTNDLLALIAYRKVAKNDTARMSELQSFKETLTKGFVAQIKSDNIQSNVSKSAEKPTKTEDAKSANVVSRKTEDDMQCLIDMIQRDMLTICSVSKSLVTSVRELVERYK